MSTLQVPGCPKPSLTPRPVPAAPSFLTCRQLLQVALNLEPGWDWDRDILWRRELYPSRQQRSLGGTSTLQFEQDHQCLCRSCWGGRYSQAGMGGLHDNLNHTRGVHALEASDEPPNDRSGVHQYWKYCLDMFSLKPNQAYLHSSPRDA